jgi:hypothetical protein
MIGHRDLRCTCTLLTVAMLREGSEAILEALLNPERFPAMGLHRQHNGQYLVHLDRRRAVQQLSGISRPDNQMYRTFMKGSWMLLNRFDHAVVCNDRAEFTLI